MRWVNVFSQNQTDSTTVELNEYLDKLYPYLKICERSKVLEIGPFNGLHTQVVRAHNPKHVTLVELNDSALSKLKYNYPDYEIVTDDIFHYLEQPRDFDVVLCCGILYHLHAPLYLLELIVNRISPQFICIETYKTPLSIEHEDDNMPGARQVLPNWKSANLKIKMPKEPLFTAMKNLGYKLTEYDDSLIKLETRPMFCLFEKV